MAGDIRTWLEELELGEFAEAFLENGVDQSLLPELNNDDLKDMGVARVADRKRILKAIQAQPSNADVPTGDVEHAAPRPLEAERRQLTVMFCDLVGSTELSARLDPEDLREVMRRYQDTVAGVVARFEGHVAKFLGDGVLTFFGWPRAYEDQAERAVRSGLAAVEAVVNLKTEDGQALAARVGIATGQVVIGDIVGETATEADAVAGETPNLAARLLELASPDQVVIDTTTRLLIGEALTLEDIRPHQIKGFAEPVSAWRVVGESSAETRFEAAHPGALTQLVGREPELALLRRAWEQSQAGIGQVVLISGEPGIGKSRLVDALGAQLKDEGDTRVTLECSPYHTNSALYPLIVHLERALRWQREDDAEAKLAKLEEALQDFSLPLDEAMPLFASLMSLPLPEGKYPPLNLTPQQQRQQTLDAIAAWLMEEAERRPVLQIWEDLHWADPSTLELLTLQIEQAPTAPILNVLTYRPEFQPPWPQRSHMTPLTLNRLERPEVEVLMNLQAGGKALPEEVVEHIVDKTDGVPLYVEELTKTILEADFLHERNGSYELAGQLSEVTIPATLQDSLMARLDRLPTIREVAQLGAVLGREFAYEMVQAVVSIEETTLQEGLAQLVDAELLYQRGRPPRSKYIFKHALVQDAAYQSLLKRKRQYYHRQVAELIEARFPETVRTQPELVAHHLTEAGQFADAIDYWHRAGHQSLHRSAYSEANAHLARGIGLLPELDASPQRDRRELGLWLDIGAAEMTQSAGSPKTGEAFERALVLCEQFEEGPEHFTALWNLWMNRTVKAEYGKAQELCGELLSLAPKLKKSDFFLQAGHAAWTTQFTLGELLATAMHTDDGRDIYDRQAHASHSFSYGGHDPGVCCNAISALNYWLLGYPDKSLAAAQAAIDLADKIDIPFSSCQASVYSAYAYQFRGEEREVEVHGNKAVDMASENGFPHWLGWGFMATCWAHVRQGRHENEIENMRRSLEELRSAGFAFFMPYQKSLLADVCGLLDQPEEGLAITLEALNMVQESGERWWQAELHRQEGQFRLALDGSAAAESCFATAIELAQRQSAKSLELRAATSLALYWHAEGKRVEARDLLYPVYSWFTEGFDTADLLAAKRFLDELA